MHLKDKFGMKIKTSLCGLMTRLEVKRPALALPLTLSTALCIKISDTLGFIHF